MPPARGQRCVFQPGQQVRARSTARDAWQTGRVAGTDPRTEHYLVRVDGQSGGKALPFAIVEPPVPACPRKELLAALEVANLTIPGPGQPQEPRLHGDHIVYFMTITGTSACTEVAARYRDMRAVAQSIKHLMPTGAAIPGKKWFGNKADEKLLRQRAHGFQVYFDRALRTPAVQASAQFATLQAFLRLDLFARQDAIRTKCQACCREAAQGIRRRYLRKLKAWSEQSRAFHARLHAAERLLVKNERGVLLVCFRRLLCRSEERIAHRRHIAEQEEAEQLRRVEGALQLEAEGRQRLREEQQRQAAELRRQERAVVFAQGIAALSAEEAGRRDSAAGVQEWLEACKPSDEPPVPAKIYYPPTPPPPLRARPTTPPIGRFWRVVGWRGDCVTPDPEAPPPETAPEPSAPQQSCPTSWSSSPRPPRPAAPPRRNGLPLIPFDQRKAAAEEHAHWSEGSIPDSSP